MGYKLTKRGVNVFLFNGGFHHSKVMSIDDDCCMIGSANLESRSLFYDHEQNAIVVDTILVNDFVEIYEADKLNSDTLTRELYKSVTPWKRFVGRLAVFLRPILISKGLILSTPLLCEGLHSKERNGAIYRTGCR